MLKAEVIRENYDKTDNVNDWQRNSNSEIKYSLLHAYEKKDIFISGSNKY